MQSLDLQVVQRALEWLSSGKTIWLCTVLSTFGSSPREPGSLMAATSGGESIGSLSGGCVEEDFLERLGEGAFEAPAIIVRYGDPSDESAGARIHLPCGGILEVLIERMPSSAVNREHLYQLIEALSGGGNVMRHVGLPGGGFTLTDAEASSPRVTRDSAGHQIGIRMGPVAKLILAGYSSVADVCANFALSLGFKVVLCDPREEIFQNVSPPPGVEFIRQLPSLYIAADGECNQATAVVALTHDPRIDDLAMMTAVKTPAFYIGVMGSLRTSQARAERLRRSGGLNDADIDRIQMPIGLDLGSKTPAEIALAVMADVVRVRRGRSRKAL